MEIRFAEAKDVSGILNLLRQVGRVHHQGYPELFRSNAQKYGASQVLALITSTKNPIFVAVEGDRVLGYSFCQLKVYENDPVICDHTELYIDDLCVDEQCRGQGIGKALYQAVCRYAHIRRCDSITLNVWCCNASAMKFYEKLGLKPQKIGMEMPLKKD
ncbi:MAG: GNAT family N-acetyltransferase [Oscillospiraceae bacterium]|nr:GNAT family N-acetyltransferase [Oscillospiraceae bacterium]